MKKMLAFMLALSLTFQMVCISASALAVPNLTEHTGLIIEKVNIGGDSNKFKLNVYAHGNNFDMTELNFKYKNDKISPYNVIANHNLAEGEAISNAIVTPMSNGIGTVPYDIADPTNGWMMFGNPNIDINSQIIQIDTSLGMQSESAKANMGIVTSEYRKTMPLAPTEEYLLYSINFTAIGAYNSDQIYSSDFELKASNIEGTIGSNSTGTLMGDSGASSYYKDVYFRGFPIEGNAVINGTPIVGQTLTATVAGVNVVANYSYVWKEDGTPIVGATDPSLSLVSTNFAGKTISVEISADGYTGIATTQTVPVVPLAPTLSSKTDTTVTLNTQPNCQYKVLGGVWQDSPVITTGLSPDTTYTFYAKAGSSAESQSITVRTLRSKPANLATISGSSITPNGKITGLLSGQSYQYKLKSGSVYTAVAANETEITGLTAGAVYHVRLATDGAIEPSMDAEVTVGNGIVGQATIAGISMVGQTLTASVTGGNAGTTYSYVWKQDGAIIVGANTNSLLLSGAAFAGKIISVEISATGYIGTVTTQAVPVVSLAPTLSSKTDTNITLNAQDNCQYRLSGGSFQDGPIFEDLTPDTNYTFYAKAGSSAESQSLTVRTLRSKPANLVTISGSSITPNGKITGLLSGQSYQYKLKSESVYTAVAANATEITGLTAGAVYYVRLATDGAIEPSMDAEVTVGNGIVGQATIAGISMVGQTLTASVTGGNAGTTYSYVWKQDGAIIVGANTNSLLLSGAAFAGKIISVEIVADGYAGIETTQTVPVVPLAPMLSSKTDTTVTLNTQPNCQYRLSGGSFQDSPIFEDLTPDTNYTFYAKAGSSAESQSITVRTLRSKPSNLVGIAPTTQETTDGQIIGLDAGKKYEYKIKNAVTAYTELAANTTTISGLKSEIYYVRLVTDGAIEPSMVAEVTVGVIMGTQVKGIVNFKPQKTDSKVTVTIYEASDIKFEKRIVQPVQVTNNAIFTLESIPAGIYTIVATAKNHTKAKVSNIVVSDTPVTIAQTLKLYVGDLAENNYIDVVDLTRLMIQYGKMYPDFDLNGDGIIDVVDLTSLMGSYGKYGWEIWSNEEL